MNSRTVTCTDVFLLSVLLVLLKMYPEALLLGTNIIRIVTSSWKIGFFVIIQCPPLSRDTFVPKFACSSVSVAVLAFLICVRRLRFPHPFVLIQ